MKADLAKNWIMMCLIPYGVAEEHRNKFVACMLGDEIATDEDFEKMALDMFTEKIGSGCKFSYAGACFHPFRPGSMCDAIFSDCLRGCSNASPLVNDKACDALDTRKCFGCQLSFSSDWYGTEFNHVKRFYEELIDDASKHRTLYGRTYEEMFDRGLSQDNKFRGFFPGCVGMKQYEDNVRRHFDKMTREHYKLVVDAIDEDERSISDVYEQNGKSALAKALLKVRLDLVTHWMNYWSAGKYKEEEA